MTRLLMTRELPILEKPAGRRANAAEAAWHRVVAIVSDADFAAVGAFVLIGLVASVYLTIFFPLPEDIAAAITQLP